MLTFRESLKKRPTTSAVVLHHAGVSSCIVEDIHRWHLENGWAGIGYHYFVSKLGGIYAGRPEDTVGAHVEGHNSVTIGVCAEGDYTKDTMPPTQKKAIVELLKDLLTRYPGVAIKRHSDYNATECPGPNFPFDDIVAAVTVPPWDPVAEIAALKQAGVINSDHDPKDVVTWGELATLINRIRT